MEELWMQLHKGLGYLQKRAFLIVIHYNPTRNAYEWLLALNEIKEINDKAFMFTWNDDVMVG